MALTKHKERDLLLMDDDKFFDTPKVGSVKSRMLAYYFGGHQYALKKKTMLSLLAFKKTTNTLISKYVGVSPQTASVAIMTMEKEGILRRKEKNFILTDPDFLWLLIKRDVVQEEISEAVFNNKKGKPAAEARALKFTQHKNFCYFFETMFRHVNGQSALLESGDIPAIFNTMGYFFWMVFRANHFEPKDWGAAISDKKMKKLLIDCWEWFETKENKSPSELNFAEEMTGIHVGFE